MFFKNICLPMKNNGRVYVSRARWFTEAFLPKYAVTLTRLFQKATEIEEKLNMEDWTFEKEGAPFPILELTVAR